MDSGRAGTTDFETSVFLGYFKDMPDHRQPGLRDVIRPSWAVPNGGDEAWCIRRGIRLLLWVGGRRGDIAECAGRRDVLGAVGVGKEPVVADAVEAARQHVQEEPADELGGRRASSA